MHAISRFLLAFLLAAAAGVCAAQSDAGEALDTAGAVVETVQKRLASEAQIDTAVLGQLREQAAQAQLTAEQVIAARAPELASVQARLAQLGPPPGDGEAAESRDVQALRAELEQSQMRLDGDIKRARFVSLAAQQLVDDIAARRRADFRGRLGQRTASPLAPAFWRDIARNAPRDFARLRSLAGDLASGLRAALATHPVAAFAGAASAMLLLTLGRWGAERLSVRLVSLRMPPGRLRRSLLAFAVVVVATLAPGLAAQVLYIGLSVGGALPGKGDAFARMLVGVVFFGALVNALGRALLFPSRPSWRLAPISDAMAQRLRRFPAIVGGAVMVGWLLQQINSLVGASLSAAVATGCLIALLNGGVVAALLRRIGRAAPARPAGGGAPGPMRPAWFSVLLMAAWIGVWASLAGVLTGYVAFASFVAQQLMWCGIVIAAIYLLLQLVDDVCTALPAAQRPEEAAPAGISARLVDQGAVLLSGLLRAVLFLLGATAILAPFGAGPEAVFGKIGGLSGGAHIGGLTIAPSAVFSALLMLVLGFATVRAVQRWFANQYLPRTALDPGLGNSLTTLIGYVGGVIVIALSLSALGLASERLTWVASALSVGIGFGLQAIVQNFVSGLILLAERPVKVGDWIVLGDTEGDVRRINVRATQIQLADRSTLIVPNSELVTKSVRNVTLGNAEGRVLLKIPMPRTVDADATRALMLAVAQQHPAVLQQPAPAVGLDGFLDATTLSFTVTAFVGSPRLAAGVRSELLFQILARLRQEAPQPP